MIGQLARRAPTYTEHDLLEGALGELESGWPVVVRGGDHYQLLLPQAAVGHRGTRRLADLALTPAKPLPENTAVAAAIAYLREAGTDFALVSRNGEIVGLVSYATLLADLAPNELADEGTLALEHILADSGDAFVLLDADNRVRMSNETGLELLRYLTTEGDADTPIANLAGVAIETVIAGSATGTSVRDFTVRADGVRKVVEVRVLRPTDDHSDRTLLLLRDVTSARDAEYDAARRTQMSGFGQLAGAIAHDFNNVLTVISAQASLLRHRLRDDAASLDSAASILDATKLAAELVERLRSFARKEPVAPRPLDVPAALTSLRRLIPSLAGEEVEVVFDVADDLEPIIADPTQLERALANLAVNAGHAMPDGGELRITAEMITADRITAAREPRDITGGHYLRLAVTDSGTGMDEATLAHCFDPHFTTRPGAGLGLGLATVYSIVSDLGGHVRARSKAGQGTTVELFLPTMRTQGPLAGVRVLVVDDDRHVAEAVSQILASEGARAVSAASAEDALAHIAASGVPDVLIADVRMPGRSGPEMIDDLRERAPALHAVLMTGEVDPAIVDAAGRLRVELVRKPFTPEALVSAITVALADTLEDV